MDESDVARSRSAGDEGMSTRYVQDATRRFGLSAAGLRFVGGFESRDGRLEDARRVLAEATVTDGALRRAGIAGEAGRIGLTLRPLAPAEGPPRLLLMLGYRGEGDAEQPFAEAFLPPAVFEVLAADLLSGLARELSLTATTSLWIRAEDRGRREGEPLDWYLGLDADGSTVLPARGFIETIAWQPPPPAAGAAPAPAPASESAPVAEEDWPESGADELRGINGSFRLLLVMLAFLLIIVALK
ncbi:hypothetical protein [Bosea sp. (in: a-proteobacteria)]|uniref:hypothetical protein n=1 Tax=Bosea sp. (in: a-proteobacteria) TaxID=1871050 RepID=UPI002616B1A6|nr:hypothetical protein [Bosea sp. (in: a-proteobacteria)]MCO5090440.1 hypothetical protein [Bosea sp. (in: a-proteobacteria)]